MIILDDVIYLSTIRFLGTKNSACLNNIACIHIYIQITFSITLKLNPRFMCFLSLSCQRPFQSLFNQELFNWKQETVYLYLNAMFIKNLFLSLNLYKQNLFECHLDAGYIQTDPKQHIQQSWKLYTLNTTFYPFHFI